MKKRAFSKEGQWAIYNRKAPATMQVALDAALGALADDPSLAERVGYRWAAPSLVERSQRPPSADLWSPLYCPTPEVWEPVIEARGDLSKHPLFPQELPRFCRVEEFAGVPEFWLMEYPLTFANLPMPSVGGFEDAHTSRDMYIYYRDKDTFLLHPYPTRIIQVTTPHVFALQTYYKAFLCLNCLFPSYLDYQRACVDKNNSTRPPYPVLPAISFLYHEALSNYQHLDFPPRNKADLPVEDRTDGLKGMIPLSLVLRSTTGSLGTWSAKSFSTIRWKLKNPPPAEMLFSAPQTPSPPTAPATTTASAT